MSEDKRPTERPLPFVPEDLVVGLAHLDLVAAELRQIGVAFTSAGASADLGLALLTLTDVSDAARRVRAAALEVPGEGSVPGENDLALNPVLWGLRRIFANRFSDWIPLVGKNRLVGRVHGAGEVCYGGGGDPTPLNKPLSLPMRGAGPGHGVRVGILDTAFYPQPWLAGAWAARYSDTVSDSKRLSFSQGHATFVAGLVLSQAPGATVEVRRVLGDAGTADSWTVAQEIVRFGRSGLDVLNLSFVCYTEDGQPPLVLAAAIDRLDPELVVVAAAGNHGAVPVSEADPEGRERKRAAWPAALDDVLAVGAADAEGGLADFSPDAPWVDLHATGVGLRSTYLTKARQDPASPVITYNGWARWSGTSFAAALVSGAVAAATAPPRGSSREAARDILRSLQDSPSPYIGNTHAKYLPLRTW